MRTSDRRLAPALSGSIAVHVLIAATLTFLAAHRPSLERMPSVSRRPFVWLPEPGPGGGGGGGGDHDPRPPRAARKPGADTSTIDSVVRPPAPPIPSRGPADDATPHIVAPIVPTASAIDSLPGAITAPPGPPTTSLGSGASGGTGSGTGPGDGPGKGRGIGPGLDAGIGNGAYRPGGDVTVPIEIRKGTPRYTSEAMRAGAQGAITIECIVQPSGVCTDIRVKRAFEPTFGLDREAIKAAAQWRFRPGMRRGEPVPVFVTLEIDFAIR